jgi:hypothetical protein
MTKPLIHQLAIPAKPATPIDQHHGAYCLSGPGNESETEIGAQRNADRTGRPQTVHHHPHDVECRGEETDCMVFDPNPIRSLAVRG